MSSGSPLSSAQKSKMVGELHGNPALGHAKKGSAELSEVAQRRAHMNDGIAKFKGKSSDYGSHRPKRKVLNRYA